MPWNRLVTNIISVGGGLSIRETEEVRIKHTEILNMAPREIFLNTFSGTYKGKTATIELRQVRRTPEEKLFNGFHHQEWEAETILPVVLDSSPAQGENFGGKIFVVTEWQYQKS